MMWKLIIPTFLSLAGLSAAVLSNQPCPLYGQNYPAPTNLLSSLHIRNASESVRSQIIAAHNETTPYGPLDTETTVFSMDFFSLHDGDNDTIFTLHYTPEDFTNQHTSGASSVNSDTIYRIGSVSKLWTAYIWLIVDGDENWNEPITKFVPELAATAESASENNAVDAVNWTAITVGALASHMAGIGRDAAYSADLAVSLEALGIPKQGGNSNSPCGKTEWANIPCNRSQFFTDFPKQHPVFAPFQTPAYSNAGYQILAYALESITNQTLESLFNTHLVSTLNLTSTSYTVPNITTNTNAIIPQNTTYSWWDADLLGDTAAGGYLSSINDMRKIGRAMLASTQLDEATTRRWMQPYGFVADPHFAAAVGAPWEIYRAPAGNGSTYEMMMTKAGDVGKYSANVILLPDWGLGISVLAAGEKTSTNVRTLSDILVETFLPAVRAAAKEEARVAYAGTYVGEEAKANFTIVVDDESTGLAVTEWFFGDEDVLMLMGKIHGENTTVRLYPTGLETTTTKNNGASTVTSAWRGVYEVLPEEVRDGVFVNGCSSWYTMASMIYGGVGLDEFLFAVENGMATGLKPRVLGVEMKRVV